MSELKYIDEVTKRYPELEVIKEDIIKAFELMKTSYEHNGKLLVGGNGGSCADSEHIVGELMKGFVKRRPLSKGLKEALVEVYKIL